MARNRTARGDVLETMGDLYERRMREVGGLGASAGAAMHTNDEEGAW